MDRELLTPICDALDVLHELRELYFVDAYPPSSACLSLVVDMIRGFRHLETFCIGVDQENLSNIFSIISHSPCLQHATITYIPRDDYNRGASTAIYDRSVDGFQSLASLAMHQFSPLLSIEALRNYQFPNLRTLNIEPAGHAVLSQRHTSLRDFVERCPLVTLNWIPTRRDVLPGRRGR